MRHNLEYNHELSHTYAGNLMAHLPTLAENPNSFAQDLMFRSITDAENENRPGPAWQ